MADSSADLENTLDRIVARLGKPGAPREARALLVDARRLQQVVRHWRTVAPTEAARLEMEQRVATLQEGAERVLVAEVEVPVQPSPPPERQRPSAVPGNVGAVVERARATPPPVDPTRASPPPARPRPASDPARGASPQTASRAPSAARTDRPKAVVEEVKPGAITDPFLRRNAPRTRDRVSTPPSLDPELEIPRQGAQRSIATPTPAVQRSIATPTPVAKSPSVAPAEAVAVRESRPTPLDEHTRAAPLDVEAQVNLERAAARPIGPLGGPIRPRTLPDLDISGIAELVEEPLGSPLRDPLDLGARNRTNRPGYEARRSPSEPPPRGRASEPPPRARPSPTPANGKRRAEHLMEDRATVEAGARPSRYSELFDDPETHDGVIYPSADEGARGSHPPHRPTPRPATPSAPPPALRSEKTAIAVKPLPSPETLDPRLIMLTEPYSPRAEAFRTLRRKLSGPGAPKTIAVTSAEPEEGKSTCAANLALAFRETSNEKVLLVEANLRSPGLAKLFAFDPPQCFAKQMAKNRDMDRASWTVAEQFEPLHVLAVSPTSRTSPMIDPVAFANALEQLVDAGYDHIIIDTPHALGGSDVNLVADIVDGVVVVAWIKKSKRSLIKKAVEQLKPATILGVVTLDG